MSKEANTRYGFNTSGSFTNNSPHYLVIVGLDAEGAWSAAGDALTIQLAGGGNVIESIELEAFGTAASETLIFLPKKILVPPGAVVTIPHGASFEYIICYEFGGKSSLENAMAIL